MPRKSKKAATSKKPATRGSIGKQTVKDVDALVAGGMKRTHAFAKVAKDSGRTAGTVASTYYTLKAKSRGPAGNGRIRRGASGAGDVLGQVKVVLRNLERVIRQQEKQIARLATEAQWAKRLRKVLGSRGK